MPTRSRTSSFATFGTEDSKEKKEVRHGDDAVTVEVARTGSVASAFALSSVGVPGGSDSAKSFFNVVANAISVGVLFACSPADTSGVWLATIAIAVAFWNICATTVEDCSRAVADSACIECSDTSVNVVAQAVTIGVS